MNTFLQTLSKSAEMAENDPHGIIITVVSVGVVFAALIILYFAYTLTGKLVNMKDKNVQEEEKPAAKIKDDTIHDEESYILTIKKSYTAASRTAREVVSSSTITNGSSLSKDVTAPLPGTIVAIPVSIGQQIKAGQTVAILEAMKMENELQAEYDGVIKSINICKGDSVLEGTIIVTIG